MSDAGQRKKVILLANRNKPQALEVGAELIKWLTRQADVVADNLKCEYPAPDFPPADYVIIIGGDGTILSTVRQLGDRQIPVIGLNMGKLGFLTEFNADQLKEHFARLISDKTLISHRVILDCRIRGPHRKDYISRAVNELVVIAGPPFRMIEVSVSIGEEHLALCLGDGLIISTPTGSTAYNLSAGGPILAASLEAAVITPLAAHSLGFRPIVIPLDRPITIRPWSGTVERSRPPQSTVMVAVDGQDHTILYENDEVTVTKAAPCFQLVHNPRQSQWRLLNAKLNWGVLPNYQRDHSE
jgi:NAD+ kinase